MDYIMTLSRHSSYSNLRKAINDGEETIGTYKAFRELFWGKKYLWAKINSNNNKKQFSKIWWLVKRSFKAPFFI